MTRRPLKILIIEDEPLVAIDIAQQAVAAGYSLCGIAVSGQEALDFAEADPPDVAITDVSLIGRVSGIEVGRILQKQYGTRIVFVTGLAIQQITLRVDFPYAGTIAKPFQGAHLLRLLADACGDSHN
jgi:CheY-like chemotaxis protein